MPTSNARAGTGSTCPTRPDLTRLSSKSDDRDVVRQVGVGLTLLSHVFMAARLVAEERLLSASRLQPMQVHPGCSRC